jgi:hypothetical protein
MKLIQTAPQQEQTFNVGDEIIVRTSQFDGRTSHSFTTSMTVTKVNRITLLAEDKKGNVYKLDPREDNIRTRKQIVDETLASIG